jgi:hypothetical protein
VCGHGRHGTRAVSAGRAGGKRAIGTGAWRAIQVPWLPASDGKNVGSWLPPWAADGRGVEAVQAHASRRGESGRFTCPCSVASSYTRREVGSDSPSGSWLAARDGRPTWEEGLRV